MSDVIIIITDLITPKKKKLYSSTHCREKERSLASRKLCRKLSYGLINLIVFSKKTEIISHGHIDCKKQNPAWLREIHFFYFYIYTQWHGHGSRKKNLVLSKNRNCFSKWFPISPWLNQWLQSTNVFPKIG
jgi:hypothetical protein